MRMDDYFPLNLMCKLQILSNRKWKIEILEFKFMHSEIWMKAKTEGK